MTMETLRNLTPDQRVAFGVLDRIYKGDLIALQVGRSLPRGHDNVRRALRALDRLVGFGEWADDESTAPGEGCRRWEWHRGADMGPLPRDRMPGCTLADHLLYAAGSRSADPELTLDQVMSRELRRLLGPLAEGRPSDYGDPEPGPADGGGTA